MVRVPVKVPVALLVTVLQRAAVHLALPFPVDSSGQQLVPGAVLPPQGSGNSGHICSFLCAFTWAFPVVDTPALFQSPSRHWGDGPALVVLAIQSGLDRQ